MPKSAKTFDTSDPALGKLSDMPGAKLGGAWMFMAGPKISLAAAMVHNISSKLGAWQPAMAVPFLGWKFWMISSCRSD